MNRKRQSRGTWRAMLEVGKAAKQREKAREAQQQGDKGEGGQILPTTAPLGGWPRAPFFQGFLQSG